MYITSNRTDVTEWAIHFVRVPKDGVKLYARTTWSMDNELLCNPCPEAFEVLKQIVTSRGLKPAFGRRNGKPTIYGGIPAVCFTEMPIINFLQYVVARNNYAWCAPYGVCLLKRELFKAGARPAVYGLSVPGVSIVQDQGNIRVIDKNLLPLSEQYRYITLDPNRQEKNHPLDWTHEREWRWRESQQYSYGRAAQNGDGSDSLLLLFPEEDEVTFFSQVGFFVWTPEEANMLRDLIQQAIPGYLEYYMPKYFIIVLSEFVRYYNENGIHDVVYRIEDILMKLKPGKLWKRVPDPSDSESASNDALFDMWVEEPF
ncbi:hypothetical protein EI42_04592 [Thermosporothrix hazakensis]|jgi:hypothetical protein|uniref:Uncharacterized protein n=2 Tax=Thermosporothrix hazakensis TaxID=644383 RepID=A0A326U2E1_THEHA|nr:hypothetical protein EI42_04592 [Thermosporothrix hazakensis]GCE48344.1 hypothetical protein KTH_32130 [Thermosporothrix hazakensis]